MPGQIKASQRVSVFPSFGTLHHDEGVRAGIDGILLTAKVIRRIVDTEGLNR